MIQETLHKAKRIDNGDWVEGYFLPAGEKAYIVCEADTNCMDGETTDLYATNWYEVDKETLCIHAGKQYMDGEKAFSGDLYESHIGGQILAITFVLKYGIYEAYCPADKCYMDNVGFYAEAAGYPQMPMGNLEDYALKIGNVYDNPELLKGLPVSCRK